MVKLKIGEIGKQKYSHSYRQTNSTTFDFGTVQPLLCRLTYPKGSIKGELRQFARCSAMPLPTFGDIRLNTDAVHIPIEDIFPNFAAFMSQKPIRAYASAASTAMTNVVPTTLPYTTNAQLYYFLTANAESDTFTVSLSAGSASVSSVKVQSASVSSVKVQSAEDWLNSARPSNALDPSDCVDFDESRGYRINQAYTPIWSKAVANAMGDKAVANAMGDASSSAMADFVKKYNAYSESLQKTIGNKSWEEVYNSYDYVAISNYTPGTSTTFTATCYRLWQTGKTARKVLLGLGYNPSLDDGTEVCVLPLLAFYKAYYDRFVPFREMPFVSTSAYQLIDFFRENVGYINSNRLNYTQSTGNTSTSKSVLCNSLFSDLLRSFREVYSTQDVDFVSLHTSTISPITSGVETSPTVLPDGSVVGDSSVNGAITLTNGKTINAVTLSLMQKMYGYFNRDSILGNRIDAWMQNHLDSATYQEYFKRTRPLASTSISLNVSDIDSTANTVDASESQGTVLGAYGGKGTMGGDLTFRCNSDTYGYFIVFAWLNPITGYWQGTDSQLFALSKYEIPQKEFDALGYEATPKAMIFTDNGIGWRAVSTDYTVDKTKGFGFVPRYSGFKYAKNTVNGDFSLRSTNGNLAPFYADRTIESRGFITVESNMADTSNGYIPTVNTIPNASDEWRYVQKQDWMGNYNRIFYNSSRVNDIWANTLHYANNPNFIDDGYLPPMDDNVFCHCVFDYTENTPLRPLSLSYYTDTTTGDGETTVTPS